MNPRTSLARKIVYLIGIALLLGPLFWLGQPSTVETAGGQLARLRADSNLSEAELGEIDPTGETIKLATLGLRGVAVNVLWSKSNDCEKRKDWTGMSAVLAQIAKLEPHFITVWRHQAWRVSYNISAQFDDFRGRYAWVIKGIEFLKEGIRYNTKEPVLYRDVGWFTAQKIGRSDEHRQFRQLFKDDDDYHGARPKEFRDNWLVGKEWYLKAQELVDGGARLGSLTPVLFFSDAPMCQMNYSAALEEDGVFDQKARLNWRKAENEWRQFGAREIATTVGQTIRLNDREELSRVVVDARARLDKLAPGLGDKILEEKRGRLSDRERAVLAKPIEQITQEEQRMFYQAHAKLQVTPKEIANRVAGANRAKALETADRLEKAQTRVDSINSYREMVNFDYWRRRAQYEQTEEALAARKAIYEADRAFEQADLTAAKAAYDEGFAQWRKLLDRPDFADLQNENELGQELVQAVERYQGLLEKRDERIADDFVLRDVYLRFKQRQEEAEGEAESSELPPEVIQATGGAVR
jgi:hypothetical protein